METKVSEQSSIATASILPAPQSKVSLLKYAQYFSPSFFIGLFAINLVLLVWSNFDHALPVYDMACHLLSGFTCADLLAHAHPLHRSWWQSLMTVNPLYPPFTYFVYGVFKLAFGPQRWVELLVQHVFSSVLYISLYGLGKSLFKSSLVACTSALLIFACPAVFTLTHYDMLDVPGLAMISLSLFIFVLWQKQLSFPMSILLGPACAFTALTKNNSVGFLIPPFIVFLAQSIYTRNWQNAKYLALVTVSGILVMSPWLVLACRTMLHTVSMYQTAYSGTFIQQFAYYLSNLPSLTSPFLFILFIAACCCASKPVHKQMVYIAASGLGGLLILSIFRWTPQVRYALPVTIPIALYCAWLLVTYVAKPKTRLLAASAILLLLFSFSENSFTPYPAARIRIPSPIAQILGIEAARQDAHHAPGGTSSYPTPASDWGYQWVMQNIVADLRAQTSKQELKQFAIMPDSEEVSSTSYSYLARQQHLPLHPFTPRHYTLAGDEFTFRPDIAQTIDWYLLKTGSAISPASHFCNKESEKAYMKWCDYIRTSALFKLVGSKNLPDGNRLELYKKAG